MPIRNYNMLFFMAFCFACEVYGQQYDDNHEPKFDPVAADKYLRMGSIKLPNNLEDNYLVGLQDVFYDAKMKLYVLYYYEVDVELPFCEPFGGTIGCTAVVLYSVDENKILRREPGASRTSFERPTLLKMRHYALSLGMMPFRRNEYIGGTRKRKIEYDSEIEYNDMFSCNTFQRGFEIHQGEQLVARKMFLYTSFVPRKLIYDLGRCSRQLSSFKLESSNSLSFRISDTLVIGSIGYGSGSDRLIFFDRNLNSPYLEKDGQFKIVNTSDVVELVEKFQNEYQEKHDGKINDEDIMPIFEYVNYKIYEELINQ